jgi:hypothetical protein
VALLAYHGRVHRVRAERMDENNGVSVSPLLCMRAFRDISAQEIFPAKSVDASANIGKEGL